MILTILFDQLQSIIRSDYFANSIAFIFQMVENENRHQIEKYTYVRRKTFTIFQIFKWMLLCVSRAQFSSSTQYTSAMKWDFWKTVQFGSTLPICNCNEFSTTFIYNLIQWNNTFNYAFSPLLINFASFKKERKKLLQRTWNIHNTNSCRIGIKTKLNHIDP